MPVAEIAARERIRQGRGMGASKTKRERDKAEWGLEVASHIPFTSECGSCNSAGTWRGGARSFGQHRVAGDRHASSVLSNSQVRARGGSFDEDDRLLRRDQRGAAVGILTRRRGWPEAPGGTGTGTGSEEDLRAMALAQTYGVDLNQIKW